MSLFLPILKCDYMERQHLSSETRAFLKGVLRVSDHIGFRLKKVLQWPKIISVSTKSLIIKA